MEMANKSESESEIYSIKSKLAYLFYLLGMFPDPTLSLPCLKEKETQV